MTDTLAIDAEQAAAVHPGWEGILHPGERILWQGRPDQGFTINGGEVFGALFALVFSGFAVFWMSQAAKAGGGFWMFGLIHFSVGLWLFWKSAFGPTFLRRRTWYTLTDRRAFIATDNPRKGKEIKSYPITADAPITYRAGQPATIYFAREQRTGNKGRRYTAWIGFERIPDGEAVMAQLRRIQTAKGQG